MTAADERDELEEAANRSAVVLEGERDLDDVELPRDVALRLVRARGRMPYGGIVHVPDFVDLRHGAPSALLDPHLLGAYLEALADVLARVADENEEKADRLRNLEHDVAAFRRLIGTETSS